jgi:hypothetical protein
MVTWCSYYETKGKTLMRTLEQKLTGCNVDRCDAVLKCQSESLCAECSEPCTAIPFNFLISVSRYKPFVLTCQGFTRLETLSSGMATFALETEYKTAFIFLVSGVKNKVRRDFCLLILKVMKQNTHNKILGSQFSWYKNHQLQLLIVLV